MVFNGVNPFLSQRRENLRQLIRVFTVDEPALALFEMLLNHGTCKLDLCRCFLGNAGSLNKKDLRLVRKRTRARVLRPVPGDFTADLFRVAPPVLRFVRGQID